MTTQRFAPLAMALALALGALPASAEHRKQEKRDTQIEKIARALEKATGEVYREAVESQRPRRGPAQRTALRSLALLAHQADRFHDQVRDDGAHDRATLRAFRRLELAYAHARRGMPGLRTRAALHRDFRRVERLMGRLDTRIARIDVRADPRRYGSRRDRGPRGWFAWNF